MGWLIAASVIALLLIFLLLPVYFEIIYDGDVAACIRYIFFRFKVFPAKEKKIKKQKKKKEEGKKPEKKSKTSFEDTVSTVINMLRAVDGKLRKVIIISKFEFFSSISGDDACEAAVSYGKLSAIINTSLAVLKNLVIIKRSKIIISPDFISEETKTYLHIKIRIIPAVLAFAVIKIFISYLKITAEENKKTITE